MESIQLETSTALEQAIEASYSPRKLIICGEAEQSQNLLSGAEQDPAKVDELIEQTASFDLDEWFDEREREFEEDWGVDLDQRVGEWPDSVERKASGLFVADDVDELTGLVIEAEQSWHIPAHLNYGGWNECPEPQVQCAIWREWQNKYGARIIAISGDVIEAWVERPPQTREAALKLAWQQYYYCSDIVEQGVETVSNLAATLQGQHQWFFWWD